MKRGVIVFALVLTIVFASLITDISSAEEEEEEFKYSNQLNANEKAAYDAFMDLTPESLIFSFELPNPIYTENSLNGQEFIEDTAKDILYHANLATQMDDPMAFWTWGTSTGVAICEIETSGELIGITSLTVNILMDSVYADDPETEVNELKEKVDAVTAAVEKFTTNKTSDKEIIEDINKYLAYDNDIKYDPNLGEDSESPYIHDPYGALVAWTEYDGEDYHMAVCDGYTKAFKLLCDKYNIENVMIFGVAHSSASSENHTWNAVKIDDKWYGVDVTWNVSSSDAYLFVGSLTIIDGYTFSASHVPGVLKEGHIVAFYPPVLSEKEIPKPGPSFIDQYGPELILIAIVALFAIALFLIGRENKNK